MPSTSSVLCSVLYPVLFSSRYCFSSTSLALQTFSCPAIVMFLSCFPIKSRIFIAFSWKSSTYFYPHSQLSDWPQPVPHLPPPISAAACAIPEISIYRERTHNSCLLSAHLSYELLWFLLWLFISFLLVFHPHPHLPVSLSLSLFVWHVESGLGDLLVGQHGDHA